MDANVEPVKQDRKIENILHQLENLNHSSRDTEERLQSFTKRLFGRIHEIETNNQKEAYLNEEGNICETILWRIMDTTAAITRISLEIDAMLLELPKMESKEEYDR